MTDKQALYKVKFVQADKLYELYVRNVYQSDVQGFVVLENFVFESGGLLVDPAEDKLRAEFEGVSRSLVPYYNVHRIDEVAKRGVSKLHDIKDGKVMPFSPMPNA
ncbi:MAG: DUF1820 family protein [Gammaproteobacteria bacterium]|nr:DUF1820 family protein [Gammaproteobacteria bacterium]